MPRRQGDTDFPQDVIEVACRMYIECATDEEFEFFKAHGKLLLTQGPNGAGRSDALESAFSRLPAQHLRTETSRQRLSSMNKKVFRRLVQRKLGSYLVDDVELRKKRRRKERPLTAAHIQRAGEILGTPRKKGDVYRYVLDDPCCWHGVWITFHCDVPCCHCSAPIVYHAPRRALHSSSRDRLSKFMQIFQKC